MSRYEQTSIWKRTLGKQLDPDPYEKDRELLRVQFNDFRDKAKLLAAEIAIDLPNYTVHDITHLDALWETAELVVKDDFELTPAEAFVLGGTFLIHDLGMGLASFPNGIDELKNEAIWDDTVASILKKKLKRPIEKKDLCSLDPETKKLATENVLRSLHAKHAEDLALVSWKNSEDIDVHLIENSALREAYGTIIGLIAHSHWWSVDELESRLPKTLGAPGIFHASWTVDPLKLACILRIADATQIDDRRAPSFLRTIRKPSEESDTHWNFQQKLYQPTLDRNRLVYTSKSPFSIEEVESWWVCNDTLKMIDNELKAVDSLLLDTDRQRLRANGITSIENPLRLSKLITVEGWSPIDAKITVSNVAKLVSNLGGKELYGSNVLVPLRELIQNASDAIRARRILENEPSEFGDIVVRFGKDSDGDYIEVEDNGVGMSQKVLTGPFLDFGESFWGTSLMHSELPGLESKGFNSTGKYGVGFFSIFMWGKKASIFSKRFEQGREKTIVLEFNDGISSRPILRKAKKEELIRDGGTRIKVWLTNNKTLTKILSPRRGFKNLSIQELIETLCPTLDCNISSEEKGKYKRAIKANDWISITPLKLLKRLMGKSFFKTLSKVEKEFLTDLAENVRLIKDENERIIGRAFICPSNSKGTNGITGVVTVGGMKTSSLKGIIGFFVGKSQRASRDIGIPIISDETMSVWASEQAELLANKNLPNETQIACASFVRLLGGKTGRLNIAYHKTGFVNYTKLKKLITKSKKNEFPLIPNFQLARYESEHNSKVNLFDNVFIVNDRTPSVLSAVGHNFGITWPKMYIEGTYSLSLKGLVIEIMSECWDVKVRKILKKSDMLHSDNINSAIIGKDGNKDVIIDIINVVQKT